MDVRIEVYTITAGKPCTCVLILFSYLLFFEGLKLNVNGDTNNLFIITLHKTAKNHVSVIKTQIIQASRKL